MANVDTYGSEGDAYRYTKKVLQTLPNSRLLESIYTEVAEKRGLSSWTRAAYVDLRATFFRDGQCKIRFAPGAARIAFGELELGTGDEELVKVSNFRDMLRIISIAHCKDYTRHLVSKDGETLTYERMLAIYGTKTTSNWSWMKRKLRRMKYGERRYKIIELDSFETAKKYADYTRPHTWCHLNGENMYKHYSMSSTSNIYGEDSDRGVNRIRLYLAVLPGFETMTTDDEQYGESMLGIDIGPGGRLIHVNNRWNHAHDNIDERKGDNKYSEIELSMLLGGPFFEICPPFTASEERRSLRNMAKDAIENNKKIFKKRMKLAATVAHNRFNGKVGARCTKIMDSRDNTIYRLKKYGKTRWLTEPLRYIPEGRQVVDLPHDIIERCPKEPFDLQVRIMTVIHTSEGAKVVWRPCDDSALAVYREHVLQNEVKRCRDSACIFHMSYNPARNHVMLMPSDHHRVVAKMPLPDIFGLDEKPVSDPAKDLTAIKVVYDIYVPLLEVNGKVFALHPAYNKVVESMENGVKFPDLPENHKIQDQFGPTEIVAAKDMSTELNGTTIFTESYNDWQGRNMFEVWKRMIITERFVCDSIYNGISMAMCEDHYTADDITAVMNTIKVIITRKSFKLMESRYANNVIATTADGDAVDNGTAVTFRYDPTGDNEAIWTDDFRRIYGDDAFYSSMLSNAHTDAQRHGAYTYRGYTEDQAATRPERGLLYLDMDAVSKIVSDSFMFDTTELTGLLSVVGVGNSVPVGVPGISGYIFTPRLEYSKIPVTKEEGILFDLGHYNDTSENGHPIIRFDNGLTLYPSSLKPMLETETLRFPKVSETMERLAIDGFNLAEDFEDINGNMLMTKGEADAREAFRDRYNNYLRRLLRPKANGETKDTETKNEPKKKRSRGVVIPNRIPETLAIPKIYRTIAKDNNFGELFMLGSCTRMESSVVDEIAKKVPDCQNFSLIHRIGLNQSECTEDESLRLRIWTKHDADGDTDGVNLIAESAPVYRNQRIYLTLDSKFSYFVPLMVKRSPHEKVSGNN